MPETKDQRKSLNRKGNLKLHLDLAPTGKIRSVFFKRTILKELIGGPPESVALYQHLLVSKTAQFL
jgi:hypothetical protein